MSDCAATCKQDKAKVSSLQEGKLMEMVVEYTKFVTK